MPSLILIPDMVKKQMKKRYRASFAFGNRDIEVEKKDNNEGKEIVIRSRKGTADHQIGRFLKGFDTGISKMKPRKSIAGVRPYSPGIGG